MTTNPLPAYWSPTKDKYGRSTHDLYYRGRVLGVVVRLPKAYIAKYGKGRSYLANDWTMQVPAGVDLEAAGKVTYHATLKAAKAHIEASVQVPA